MSPVLFKAALAVDWALGPYRLPVIDQSFDKTIQFMNSLFCVIRNIYVFIYIGNRIFYIKYILDI